MRRLSSGLFDALLALAIVSSVIFVGNAALDWGGNRIIIQ